MTTIDNLLLKIVNSSSPSMEELIPIRDSKVLRSLSTSVNSNYFITENQSKLLVRILKENRENLNFCKEELDTCLQAPTWSKPFRQIEQVRKIYLDTDSYGAAIIRIEFTYSSQIRKSLVESKKIEGIVQVNPGKIYVADYTEKNIVSVIDILTPYNFSVDDVLQGHYKTIKSWSEKEVKNQFLLENITSTNFVRMAVDQENLLEEKNEAVVLDRSKRYNYFLQKSVILEKSPLNLIANREKTKVWIPSTKFSLTSVIESLVELRRLPLLVIFPNYEDKKLPTILKNLSKSLDENGIFDNIGIYFRMSNDSEGKTFNQFIADRKYNSRLDNTIKVVGIQSGKIPKFLLSTDWQPMSVISLDTNIRNNKAGIYSDRCDLVITYSEQGPIIGNKY